MEGCNSNGLEHCANFQKTCFTNKFLATVQFFEWKCARIRKPRLRDRRTLPGTRHQGYSKHDAKNSDVLNACCRDVLDTRSLRHKVRKLGERSKSLTSTGSFAYIYPSPSFTHRTILDYLETRETSELLNKHRPREFHDINFQAELMIAEAKFTYNSCRMESKAEAVFQSWTRLEDALSNLCETQLQEDISMVVRLAEEADDIALRYPIKYGHLLFEVPTNSDSRQGKMSLISLCVQLASTLR